MGELVIRVPDVGEGVAEVELVSWAVEPGDSVRRNQVLAEVMTDKANVEIPAPADGVVAGRTGEVGGVLAVGSELLRLDVEGDVGDEPAEPSQSAESSQPSTSTGRTPPEPSPAEPGPSPVRPEPPPIVDRSAPTTPTTPAAPQDGPPRPEGERPRASPAVRARARAAGVDLRRVLGTGPAGRITADDLDAFLGRPPVSAAVRPGRARREGVDVEPIIGVRRRIAERMVEATTTIPHITYVDEVDVTALESLRTTLNDERRDDQPRLTLLPFLVRALVDTVDDFPNVNAHVDDADGLLRRHRAVHVGIATQTDQGLVVPVVRHAEAASIWALAAEIDRLATAARAGRATRDELTGSTITITSLGALGGLVTTPVINKPEVAVVGVNKIVTRPVYLNGALVPRQMMNLSSSFDHRVIDGWDAATFVQAVRRLLEQPALLFLDES